MNGATFTAGEYVVYYPDGMPERPFNHFEKINDPADAMNGVLMDMFGDTESVFREESNSFGKGRNSLAPIWLVKCFVKISANRNQNYYDDYIEEHEQYEMLVIGPIDKGEHWAGYLSELSKFDSKVDGIAKKRGNSDGQRLTVSHY